MQKREGRRGRKGVFGEASQPVCHCEPSGRGRAPLGLPRGEAISRERESYA